MLIEKVYKFYAAHRNEELKDKCSNLHGHRYGLRCYFKVEREGAISTLFGNFDDKVEPWIKEKYDHGMLINIHDPLYKTLQEYQCSSGETLKFKEFDGPTSVENLAYMLFSEITEMGFDVNRIEVRETDTSVLVYTHEDWVSDRRRLAKQASVSSAS